MDGITSIKWMTIMFHVVRWRITHAYIEKNVTPTDPSIPSSISFLSRHPIPASSWKIFENRWKLLWAVRKHATTPKVVEIMRTMTRPDSEKRWNPNHDALWHLRGMSHCHFGGLYRWKSISYIHIQRIDTTAIQHSAIPATYTFKLSSYWIELRYFRPFCRSIYIQMETEMGRSDILSWEMKRGWAWKVAMVAHWSMEHRKPGILVWNEILSWTINAGTDPKQ
jgi:hypothetical protein